MRARLKVSRAGVELIKSFEGLRSTAARLPDGRWTLGYGHTFSAREGATCTQEDADALLRFDLLPIVDAINNLVLVPLNQNQFDSLVSFCFNIGVDNFAASSVCKRINEGRMTEAALAMDSWRSAEFNGQTYVLAPLIRRRAAEKNLFLTPDDVSGHAPSLLVRPIEDGDSSDTARPSEVEAPDRNGMLSARPFGVEAAPPAAPFEISAAPERQVIDLASFTAREPGQPKPTVQLMADVSPTETVVEHLPSGLVSTGSVREAVTDTTPSPYQYDTTPAMSPEIQAALARAQEEKRQEDRRQEDLRLQQQAVEQRMRDEALRQAEALAAARAAEDLRQRDDLRLREEARLEAARLEAVRIEAERAERERQLRDEMVRAELARLEQARHEQQRLEQQRIEAARFEAERLERERHNAIRFEAERLDMERQQQARLEAERAEAVRAEAARLEAVRLDAARLDAERLERERALEQARLEQARLEQDRIEQARQDSVRLEAERLDAVRAEVARLETARLESERQQQEKLEQERAEQLEAERQQREREEQAQLEQARLEAERIERERLAQAAPVAAPEPAGEEAEKARKAEAAAALMRLYSPYGGGGLGRPLNPTVLPKDDKPALEPDPAPRQQPQLVVAPVVPPEPEPVAEDEISDGEEVQVVSDTVSFAFKPASSATQMPAPQVTALNPYARPIAQATPQKPVEIAPEALVEVPRPVAVDLSAAPSTPTSAINADTLNWRDKLQRPLPSDFQPEQAKPQPAPPQSAFTAPPAASPVQAAQAARFDEVFDTTDDWTNDDGRISLSREEMEEETVSWWKMIVSTVWWIMASAFGLVCLGFAAAAYYRATNDPVVLRSGTQGDLTALSVIAAAAGIFFVIVSVWLIMKRLAGLKD